MHCNFANLRESMINGFLFVIEKRAQQYDPKQLAEAVKVEKEHKGTILQLMKDVRSGNIKPLSYYYTSIGKDHLDEFDDYYLPWLKNMEMQAKRSK